MLPPIHKGESFHFLHSALRHYINNFFNNKIFVSPCDVSCLPYITNGLTVVFP